MLKKDIKFRDQQLLDLPRLIEKIEQENIDQLKKWGVQDATLFEWLAWTTEEFGEFAQAINELVYREGNSSDVVKEGIQLVTLVLKIVNCVMQAPFSWA